MPGPIKNVIKPSFPLRGNRGGFFPLAASSCNFVADEEFVTEAISNILPENLPEGYYYIIMEDTVAGSKTEQSIVTEWPPVRIGIIPG